jgi:hypothetical protein
MHLLAQLISEQLNGKNIGIRSNGRAVYEQTMRLINRCQIFISEKNFQNLVGLG